MAGIAVTESLSHIARSLSSVQKRYAAPRFSPPEGTRVEEDLWIRSRGGANLHVDPFRTTVDISPGARAALPVGSGWFRHPSKVGFDDASRHGMSHQTCGVVNVELVHHLLSMFLHRLDT
jgi:hypothetical protein